MTLRLLRPLIAFSLLLILFNSSIFACGPFAVEAVFVYTVHPAYPLENYAKGEIGVVQPSYARSYLYVAYRHLSNSPFTPEEQRALTELWSDRLNNTWDPGEQDWIKSWNDARLKVAGITQPSKIQVYRNREKPNEYETYLNCTKDSFDTAITTLNDRVKKDGVESPAVRAWVEGQDLVFANCSEGKQVPPQLATEADALARADRAYQIAAANFYSSGFDEAQKDFAAIASDPNSPWRTTAPYLAARTLVRKASLGAPETKNEALTQAEAQLRKVLADKNLAATHGASQRLLDLVRLRLRPVERLHELAQTLVSKRVNQHLKQDLWDYTVLLDQALETEEPAKSPIPQDDLKTDSLTDWIATLEAKSPESSQHSISRWQTTHSLTWLVSTLSKVDGQDANASELISQALKVPSSSAAFASARFHAVRLLIDSGKVNDARTLLDQLLKNNRQRFDASSLNLLISQRMMVATTLADFLSYVPRVPATLSWNDDGREIPSDADEVSDETKKLAGKAFFDYEASTVLNSKLPLSLLKEALATQSLPLHLRQDLAQATWMRAVLLGDYKTADELVPIVKLLIPSLTNQLDAFTKATQPDAKKFSALYTWLKFPGIEPIVDQGISRDTPLIEQDSYRDNWWCTADYNFQSVDEEEGAKSFVNSGLKSPVFLTDAQRAAGAKEWTSLKTIGPIPNYLSRQVIQWATKNPADPRVPEALHLAVNSTRYGCTDKETGRWSKAAFDLLHGKYPTSSWAKKTKYWFKE